MSIDSTSVIDALFHNVEHTILVTSVGQEIIRGKHLREGGVTNKDWLHFIISLLCHDIGYVKGVIRRDRPGERQFATGLGDGMVTLRPGVSDASLAPYHVDRGKQFVEERFRNAKFIDPDVIKKNIELTRFPVPTDDDHKDVIRYPGLLRAADLIGQLSDPRYLNKVGALYYEFEEMGVNQRLGFTSPEDLRKNYPSFYWHVICPYIKESAQHLSLTQEGKQILANLYANVFVTEHGELANHPLKAPDFS